MNTMNCTPNKVNRRMNGFFNPAMIDSLINDVFNTNEFPSRYPAINIAEEENKFILELVAPGFEKEQFSIDLEDNKLTISAAVKKEETANEKKYSRNEFKMKEFSRTFTLPENSDSDNIKAEFKNGILFLEIPKKAEEKKSKQIIVE